MRSINIHTNMIVLIQRDNDNISSDLIQTLASVVLLLYIEIYSSFYSLNIRGIFKHMQSRKQDKFQYTHI